MKLLLLDSETSWRGGQRQTTLLTEGLLSQGINCTVAAPTGAPIFGKLPQECSKLELPRFNGFNPLIALKVARYCAHNQIDIVDAQSAKAHTLGLIIKQFNPTPTLIVHRRVDYVPSSKWKYLSSSVKGYIAISEAIAKILRDFGVSSDKIHVARSATPKTNFVSQSKTEAKQKFCEDLGLSADRLLIANVAALSQQKDHLTFLSTLKLFQERKIPFYAIVAGDGPLKNKLVSRAKKLGLEDDVRFIGFQPRPEDLLHAADLFLLTSEKEGLGTSLFDAIHAGCAIVASNVGGIPEIVLHGETGLLAPPKTPVEFAENIETLTDPKQRENLVSAAQDYIGLNFSVQGMVESNISIYRQVLA